MVVVMKQSKVACTNSLLSMELIWQITAGTVGGLWCELASPSQLTLYQGTHWFSARYPLQDWMDGAGRLGVSQPRPFVYIYLHVLNEKREVILTLIIHCLGPPLFLSWCSEATLAIWSERLAKGPYQTNFPPTVRLEPAIFKLQVQALSQPSYPAWPPGPGCSPVSTNIMHSITRHGLIACRKVGQWDGVILVPHSSVLVTCMTILHWEYVRIWKELTLTLWSNPAWVTSR